MEKTRIGKTQGATLSLQCAAALGENVAHPLGLGPVGEGYGEAVAVAKNPHRSAVFAMSLTSDMSNDAPAREISR